MDAKALLKYLQEQALYNSMFRFLQLRASDVVKICRGAFLFLDPDTIHPDGWTLNQAFAVIGYLIDPRLDVRGPVIVDERDVRRCLSHLPRSGRHRNFEERAFACRGRAKPTFFAAYRCADARRQIKGSGFLYEAPHSSARQQMPHHR